MFKTLFMIILLVTLAVNMIFLLTTKEKPPDEITSTLVSLQSETVASSERRLFLRSNDFYDYSSVQSATPSAASIDGNRSQSKLLSSTFDQTGKMPNHQSAKQLPRSPRASKVTTVPSKGPETGDEYYLAQRQQRPITVARESDSDDAYDEEPAAKRFKGIKRPVVDDGGDKKKTNEQSNDLSESQSVGDKDVVNERVRVADDDKELNRKRNLRIILRGWSTPQVNHTRAGEQTISGPPGYLSRQDDRDNVAAQVVGGAKEWPNRDEAQVAGSGSNDSRRRRLSIKVKSSYNHVFISVNNIVIYESKSGTNSNTRPPTEANSYANNAGRLFNYPITRPANGYSGGGNLIVDETDSAEGRGIHVVVLNEHDGFVMARRVFDTYSPSQDEELCHFISMIRDGRLLIFAVKDEGSFKMPMNSGARELLQKLGSRQIMKLKWRDMWAFVVRKVSLPETNIRLGESRASALRLALAAEHSNLAEGLAKSARFSEWAPPVLLETSVDLAPSSTECRWNSGDEDEDRRRREFCSKIEGYGQVCDCDSPAPISFKPKELVNSQLNQVPIVVMAGNRPFYLYRMLRTLLAAQGLNQSMVTVFIDGFYDEPLALTRLLKLRAIQQRPLARRSARISHHYKSSLTATFQLFARADYAIIFEEDLDVAPDALVYFNQTLDLLKQDPSLYCVSAWNDQGYEHTSGDPALIYRVETMPGLGWMLSRKLYKDELELNWPSADQPHDWDMWIRTGQVRKERECLIPDVSRTFHFGATGTNINSYFQRQYFSKHAFNLAPQSRFAQLDQLTSEPYEQLIEQLVAHARVLTTSLGSNATEYLCSLAHPSSSALLSAENGQHTKEHDGSRANVIFVEMIDKQDFGNWLELAKCWRIWDLDPRGQHNSMWRLFLGGRHTLVVGSPASPYSRLKPASVEPFKLVV